MASVETDICVVDYRTYAEIQGYPVVGSNCVGVVEDWMGRCRLSSCWLVYLLGCLWMGVGVYSGPTGCICPSGLTENREIEQLDVCCLIRVCAYNRRTISVNLV